MENICTYIGQLHKFEKYRKLMMLQILYQIYIKHICGRFFLENWTLTIYCYNEIGKENSICWSLNVILILPDWNHFYQCEFLFFKWEIINKENDFVLRELFVPRWMDRVQLCHSSSIS